MPPANPSPVGVDLGPQVVGDLPVEQLRVELSRLDVGSNENAEWLLSRPEMHLSQPVALHLVACTVADLGLADGGVLDEIFAAAHDRGLALCPLATGAYLRLRLREPESTDSEMRRRRPPDASLHVASPIIDRDVEVPKGFYLRTVEGRRWLRGYRCSDDYLSPPETTYVFACAD